MKFKNLFLFAAIAIVASCGKYEFDASQVNQEVTNQNAKNQLGVEIDPNQNWRPIRQGSVTITANADLENIVKVQVLTESPFSNEDAMVLSSKDCSAGQQVTLKYEAPDYLTELVAACVNDKGVYYIKVFDINTTSVDFKSANARTRADENNGFPSTIILGKSMLSFNAQRAEASMNSPYLVGSIKDKDGNPRYYSVWSDGSWAKDRLWEHQTVEGAGGWTIEKGKGTISRTVSDGGDYATIQKYVGDYLKKTGGSNQVNNRANNWQNMVEDVYFKKNNNHLKSDGKPLILIPVQINTTDGAFNTIYYYYYNPATAPTDSIALANYIKTLPKFRAVNGYKGNATFSRNTEYLLPYYGDGEMIEGTWASPVIPKGYMIGFLNRKAKSNDLLKNDNGCIYGYGRLNFEVNHLSGHFFSVIKEGLIQNVATDLSGSNLVEVRGTAKQGMNWDSPRIGIFSANNRTYLCFEDGSDLNFCDMIVEVKQGTEIIQEAVAPEVEAATYTMCFEDRPQQADYDMNDVVLTAERISTTKVRLTLLACGAQDNVTLHGTHSSVFENNEIHKILNLPEGQYFANTKIGDEIVKGVSDEIEIGDTSIEEFLAGISIKNEVTGFTVRMPNKGESPFAIIVPMFFNYPKEGTNIKKAYPEFINWVQNMNANKDWYRSLEGVDRFPTLILRNK